MAAVAEQGAAAAPAEPRGAGPFSRFEWMVALRYLRARRRETFISVISVISLVGIALGVMTLITVLSVMNGFRAELISKILGINGHIVVQPIDTPLDDYAAVTERIRAVPGVTGVLPIVEGQALASSPANRGVGALVRGIREADLAAVPGLEASVTAGSFLAFDDVDGVAVGSRLAATLGLRLGDGITLTTPDGDATPFGVAPRVKTYPIIAIFEIGMAEYDSTFIFMPFTEAQLYFNMAGDLADDGTRGPGTATAIEIYTDDPDGVDAIRPLVDTAMERQGFLVDWRQRNSSFFSALAVERNVMFLILMLIILVAVLNIISGLTMLVKEKGRNIAILRTVGATRGSIMRIFFITGATIGTVGTFIGLVLGILLSSNAEAIRQFFARLTGTNIFSPEYYFLSQLPSDMDPKETITVVVVALVLCFLATLYPAWRAARIDPVEALRYE
ncbi:MAG: lipoprotein-releasing ABC transporter permease subunit [Bauldia sp.]|nr:lipoprotein-releasing ABC transporter permease subunit [Bauldia sp.]